MRKFRGFYLALGLCLASALSFAQTGSAPVQGAVRDATGAVVPNAEVVLTKTDTAVVQKTKTNEAGLYVFPASPIGPYKLTVSVPGMETWEGNLVLQAGLAATVDVTLKVGGTATQVTVGDVTPMVDFSTPTISERIDRARIEQLPVNDAMGLVALTTPGFEGGSLPRVFGLRDDSIELTVDGGPQSNRSEGGPQGAAPEATYIQEVQVNTLDSSAKFNRPGTVVVVTKSGTNQLHGQLYEANQDNSVAGVARRREATSNTPPFLITNQFGGSVGGPVIVPKIYNGRNRTFFFFDAYRYYLRQNTSVATSVPDAAQRSGDFSGLTNASSQKITLYDPYSTGPASANYSRTPFPNNQIPGTMLSPLAKYLYSITPMPTVSGINPQVGNNWISGFPAFQNRDGEILRFDHAFSDNDHVFVRLSRGGRTIASPSTTTSAPLTNNTTNLTYNIYPDRNGVISWTHSFSPTFFSEFLFSNSWENYSFHTGTDALNNVDAVLGLPNPFNGVGWPAISNTGYGTTYSASTPRGSVTNIYNGQENLTKVLGKHKFQFGGGIRFEHDNVLPQQQQVPGSDSFGTNYTALYNPASGTAYQAQNLTGSPAAEMYMGLLETYNNNFVRSYYLWRYQEYALYFQDEFKVSPRLTVNYGMRWEYRPPISEARNNLISFDKAHDAIVLPLTKEQMVQRGYTNGSVYDQFVNIGMKVETPQQAGMPNNMVYPNKRDFGPRAGVAYRLGSSYRAPVLRAGYGLYYFPIHSFGYEAGMRSNPPESDLYTYSFNSSQNQPLQNWALLSAPTVIAGKNSTNVVNVTAANAIAPGSMNPIVYFNPHLPTTRGHQWNVTLEKEFMENTVFGASWVGTAGRNLDQSYQYNAAPNAYVFYTSQGVALPTGAAANSTRQYDQSTWNAITEYSHFGYSNYEGLRLELLRRFTKGYAFQWYYVLANSFTSATANSNTSTTASLVPLDTNLYLPGAVPTNLDQLNRFLNYQRDPGSAPKHHMQWNFIVDLPFGKGKRLGRNAGKVVNAAIGGWQLAGTGSMTSTYNALPTNNWGNLGQLQMYGKDTPVQDCRSGTCVAGYLWYNAYIPANQINKTNAAGQCTGVCGIPSNYKPIETPLYPTPATGAAPPNAETNNVFITLKNGNVVQTPLNTNLHPFRNQYFMGPLAWGQNATMFKSFTITERTRLRFEADFFNVFNAQGLNQPNASGISSLQTSAKAPRSIQLTLRLFY
jgi:hypothetical protein